MSLCPPPVLPLPLPVPAPVALPPEPIPPLLVTQTGPPTLAPVPPVAEPVMGKNVAVTEVHQESGNDGVTLSGRCPVPIAVSPPQGISQKMQVEPFSSIAIPAVLPARVSLRVTESLLAPPQEVAPAYVVFGGARYDHVPFVRKPPAHVDPHAACERAATTERAARRHIAEQLDIAAAYLRLEPRASPLVSPPRAAKAVRHGQANPTTPAAPQRDDAFAAKSIWTAAYAASVKKLYSLIAEEDKYKINAKGYVQYNRRQYGLKRCGEEFVLGLGQKASPLQFAAVGGHLDNVVLLLHCGAKDDTAPRLKDILGEKIASVIDRLRCGTRGKRGARDVGAKETETKASSVCPSPPRLTAEEVRDPM